jgi:tRNA nucleotidyltransferase/poly(A) polymerase
MQRILPENLITLSRALPAPLYVVGGSVRDFLAGLSPKSNARDWDICAPVDTETLVRVAENLGYTVKAVYKNTGTVKLQDMSGVDYEFSQFRSDEYVRGVHTPVATHFTTDIRLDALRRDFTANAVYFDVATAQFVDPLDGIKAIYEKRLTTVRDSSRVFGEDGLRLMRLARQAAQLGFTPDRECMQGAKQHADLILDISPERIYAELLSLLTADEKYGVENGHFHGLCILNETRVLDRLFPQLTLGRGMEQRVDFHKYDVLDHSLRAALYAPKEIRLAALLHDVGKPVCKLRDGNSFAHPEEGANIASELLTKLKAPKRTVERVRSLIALHMYDFDCKTRENKLRRFFVENLPYLDDLLALKQADFSACTDDCSTAPTRIKWQTILDEIRLERAPLSLKELAVNGNDLLAANVPPHEISKRLHALLLHAVVNPTDNQKARLIKLAKHIK